jgi:DNA mismatch repair protein MutS2
MSDDVIERAKLLVRSENKKFENVLEKLEEDRVVLEKEKVRAAQIRRELEEKNAETERLLKKKLHEAEASLEKAKEEARRLIASSKSSSNYIFAELDKLQKRKDEDDFKRTLNEMKASLKSHIKSAEKEIYSYMTENNAGDELEEEYVLPRELIKGDKVLIKDSNLTGVVESEADKDGQIQIKAGIINLKTSVSNIRLLDEKSAEKINKSNAERSKMRTVKKSPDREIKSGRNEVDVRGHNGEEAWFIIDRFLDDAKISGLESVRVIHGKGTGALRNALWKFFRTDNRIASFRLGQHGEGDSGVTVIEFK